MCSLRLVLGWQPLLETDEAALPTLSSLCQALDVETHWDEAEKTLYIKSPTIGKKVAVIPVDGDTPGGLLFAGQIGHAIAERLSEAGAEAKLVNETTGLRGFDVGLKVDLATLPGWGVAVGYPLLRWFESRKLATALVEEVAGATGLLNLGTRVMLGSAWRAGVPVMSVLIGRPDAAHSPGREVQSLGGFVADGVYRGLARFWADPMLEEIQRLLPIFQAEAAKFPRPAAPPAAPEPVPITNGSENEPLAEEVPVIYPDPVTIPESVTIPEAATAPPAESCRCVDMEPEVVAASDPTKPPAPGLDRIPRPVLPGTPPDRLPRPSDFRHLARQKPKPKKPDGALARLASVPDEEDPEPPQPLAAPLVSFARPLRPVEARLASASGQGSFDPRQLPNSSPVYIFQRPVPGYPRPATPTGTVLPVESVTTAPETPEPVDASPAATLAAEPHSPEPSPETVMPCIPPVHREQRPKVQVIEGSQRIIRFP